MGKVKGNTTIMEVADTTLVSQRSHSFSISDEFLDIAGYSGKAKSRKPRKKYSMMMQINGLYDIDNPNASAKLLLDKITTGSRVKVALGNDIMGYNQFYGYVQRVSEDMKMRGLVTYKAQIVSDSIYENITIPWTLADGTWNDSGVWKDFETWQDN